MRCETCSSGHPFGELHDYQTLARDFLRNREKAVLMLDMGLGKTACVLSAIQPHHTPVLVVAPKKVAEETWDVERDKWRPDLSIAVAKGGPEERRRALNSGADVLVIGRDNLRDVADTHLRPRTFVIDELSGYKSGGNRGSVRWKTARRLITEHDIRHIWGLTGTPAPNGYLDLWGQIGLIDGGHRLGRNLTGYRNRYFFPKTVGKDGTVYEWGLREEAAANIKAKIEDVCLAMSTVGRISLPPLTFNDLEMTLPPRVRASYDEFERELAVDVREIFGGEIHTAANAAVLTSRLSQMTAGFLYVDDAAIRGNKHTLLHEKKLDRLEEVVDSPHEGGVLAGYRFEAERDMILRRLNRKEKVAHTIHEPGVVKAWNRGEIPVLLAHPASAGHGLNLQDGGHTLAWTSPTWDLEHWDQFNKRLARQGQRNPVVSHLIIDPDTIDAVIRSRLETKSDVQQDLLAYLESPV